MAFSPKFNELGPRIVAEGLQEQNRTKLAEQAMLMEGLERAGKSVAQMGQQWKQQKLQRDVNDAKVQAFLSVAQQDPDLVGGMEFVNKMVGEKNQDKLSVHLAMAEGMFQQNQRARQQQELMEREFALRAGLAQMEQASKPPSRAGTPHSFVDPESGRKYSGYFGNNEQFILFPDQKRPSVEGMGFRRQDLGNGQFVYVDETGKPLPAGAIQTTPTDPVTNERVTNLKREVAKFEGEVARRGADAKDGLNWFPFSPTIGKKLEGAKAELQSLQGGNAGAGSQVQAAAAVQASGRFKSAEEVKAAYRAGQVSKEEAARVLRQEFGMQ